jgi:hypothetical protein
VGWEWSTHGRDEKCIQNFVEKHERRRPLGRLVVSGRKILKLTLKIEVLNELCFHKRLGIS